MCTTLHLLLGDRHPHELSVQHSTKTHMLALHRALSEWLVVGTTPTLGQLGCLHHDVRPPPSSHTGSYPLLSIAATTSLTKGQPWRPVRSLPIEPRSTITTPSLASVGSHVSKTTLLFSYDPNGYLPDPQSPSGTQGPHESRYASPQALVSSPTMGETSGTTYQRGQTTPTPSNPAPG